MRNTSCLVVALASLYTLTVGAQTPSPATCHSDLGNIKNDYGTANAVAAFTAADCSDRTVYCVDASGYPVPSEQRDPHLRAGETLNVKLFGPDTCDTILTVSTDTKRSSVTLFPVTTGPNPTKRGAGESTIKQLATAKVAVDADTDSVTIFVARTDVDQRVEGISLGIVQPRYYLDVGMLVAFTPYFQQVSTSRIPGLQDQFIRETNTIRAAAAITVNYFPFGQYSQPRFTGYHGLGFQAGIGGNLARLGDEFYMGILWEPIPGAGISTGLALLEMQQLQPDYPTGALVQPNDVPKDTFLGPRWYFGVSLNTHVFQTLLSLGANARVPQ